MSLYIFGNSKSTIPVVSIYYSPMLRESKTDTIKTITIQTVTIQTINDTILYIQYEFHIDLK